MSVDPPPNLPPRKKLDVEQPLANNRVNAGRLSLYAIITIVLIAFAAYQAVVEMMPLTSPYVIAPAIGAIWFALRLFMIWSANARG